MDKPAQPAQSFRQILVSENETTRLRNAIRQDFLSAQSNHDERNMRFVRYYRMWRGLPESKGNQFQVPMMKWISFAHWSRIMQALLGDDAQIVGKPTAPGDDEKLAKKAGSYLTWRLFEYMRGVPSFAAWTFRTALFGRAHIFMPYAQEFFWERNLFKNGMTDKLDEQKIRWQLADDDYKGRPQIDVERLCYDGPKIHPLWPSEIILPAQDGARVVGDFDWKIRRCRITPQELLDGESRGKYQGIRDRWDEIWAASQQRQERNYTWDYEKIAADEAEGVSYANILGTRNSLEMWEWYGKWRFLKGKQDGRPENLDRRMDSESEIVVSMLPLVSDQIVGIQDLRELYPKMRRRDPFVDLALTEDGSYWCPGIGELIEDIQRKSTANYALFERAGKFSVGPVIFYRPSAGAPAMDTFVYEPDTAVACEDPKAVNVVRFEADFDFSEKNQQALGSFAEKVSGDNDQALGQSVDRPNAPRTLGGQALLAQGANTRIELDFTILRDYLSVFLEQLWALDREFADDELFFRVTGEDADGLFFDTKGGFASMTPQEREHSFDFQLKFATTVWSKEAKKQEVAQLYALAMQNPLVQQNPRALWQLLNKVWVAIGDGNLADIVPQPPDTGEPKDPKLEWSEILKGEDVQVNPLDDDDAHIMRHRRDLEDFQELDASRRDPPAERALEKHIAQHFQQKRHKMLLQQVAQQIQQQMQQQGAQPGQQPPAAPGGPGGPPVAPELPLNNPANPNGPGLQPQPGAPVGAAQ